MQREISCCTAPGLSCWRDLKLANPTMSHSASNHAWAPCSLQKLAVSQCAMLLLTSMPCPRCPTCPECPSPASHLANHPSRLRSGDCSRKPFPHRPGWVRWPLCVSSSWNFPHVLCHQLVYAPQWTMFLQRKGQVLLPGPVVTTENVFCSAC